jgi:rhodanese-related sulfurtransferase
LAADKEERMPGRIDLDGLRELLARGAQLVEVLPAAEYTDEHLPGAINLPSKNWTPPPPQPGWTKPARWSSTAGTARKASADPVDDQSKLMCQPSSETTHARLADHALRTVHLSTPGRDDPLVANKQQARHKAEARCG